MKSCLFRFFCLVILLFVTHYSFASGDDKAVSENESFEDIAGAWLINPSPYDYFLSIGVFDFGYPVILVSPEGRFRAYVLGTRCKDYQSIFLDKNFLETKDQEACLDWLLANRQDFYGAQAVLVAQGRVHRNYGNILFMPDSGSPAVLDIVSRIVYPYKTELVKYFLFSYLFQQPVNINTNTFRFLVKGLFPKDLEFSFSRYPVEIMADAMVSTFWLGGSGYRYSRCILDYYIRFSDEKTALGNEVKDLRRLMREIGEFDISSNSLQIKIMNLVGKEQGLANQKIFDEISAEKQALDEKWPVLSDRLFAHPAYQASEKKKLGEYLGCPDRDLPKLPVEFDPGFVP